MKTFNFYLILIIALVAAIATVVGKESQSVPHLPSFLGFGIAFLSAMFCALDARNRRLVRNGEAALQHLDMNEHHARQGSMPHVLEIIARDDYITALDPERHISYSIVLKTIFFVFGFAGLIFGLKAW